MNIDTDGNPVGPAPDTLFAVRDWITGNHMIASGGDPNPPIGMRVFWALTEGAVAATLVVAGGLRALQAAAIGAGLPFTIVLLVVMLGIFKGLRSERDGVTLDDVAAGPLFEGEGEDESEAAEHRPIPARRPGTTTPTDEQR